MGTPQPLTVRIPPVLLSEHTEIGKHVNKNGQMCKVTGKCSSHTGVDVSTSLPVIDVQERDRRVKKEHLDNLNFELMVT